MFNTHYITVLEDLIRSNQLLLVFSKEPIDLYNELTKEFTCLLTKESLQSLNA